MRAIMVMYDSLNRRMLPPYGCDWVHAPNFSRLADKCVTFDRAYVGSMPCMPARRELHTGRYNFLHRSWGPLEPFDDSMPEILARNGIYSHLASDHYHYWEEGGCTYHTKYRSWDCIRGQEGDWWKGEVKDPEIPPCVGDRDPSNRHWRQDWINRKHMPTVEETPQNRTFSSAFEFLRANADADNWFLHLETFDPHEPYFTHKRYKEHYPHEYKGKHFDWPSYGRVRETPEEVAHCRYESAALHTMCDDYLGRVLDLMDTYSLWDDTLLIVNTDHGFLLGEHDQWAKCVQPFYNEVANMPLFVWDPRSRKGGEHRRSLVQTIDIPATILDYFGVERPSDMQGIPLAATVRDDTPVREAGLFGLHGGQVNVTDGRYVYMRGPANETNQPLNNYTVMPTHMRTSFTPAELRGATLAPPFAFTKECPTLCVPCPKPGWAMRPDDERMRTVLYDLERDPAQEHPFRDAEIEKRMAGMMVRLMKANDAPVEQYERLGLPMPD